MHQRIKLLVIDVDGTLTDSGVYYDEHGNELKKFCTKDAAGFAAAKAAGIQTMVLTGRSCNATLRRMQEVGATLIIQGIKDKQLYLQEYMETHGLTKDDLGYIGDDLNDYAPMQLASFRACPADACPEIKDIATYISPIDGGHGAARDVIEHLLKEYGIWDSSINSLYGVGV